MYVKHKFNYLSRECTYLQERRDEDWHSLLSNIIKNLEDQGRRENPKMESKKQLLEK